MHDQQKYAKEYPQLKKGNRNTRWPCAVEENQINAIRKCGKLYIKNQRAAWPLIK